MINRDVCSADKTSDDPAIIYSIQAMAGTHLVTRIRVVLFKGMPSVRSIRTRARPPPKATPDKQTSNAEAALAAAGVLTG